MNDEYYIVHNIGTLVHKNYVSLEKILPLDKICFDDVYRSVHENWDYFKGKDVILFVIGNYIGKDNSWNMRSTQRQEFHCTWEEIMKMVYDGAKLGWHTWSHPNLTVLSDEEIRKECTPPFPMDFFAYPFGSINPRVKQIVKEIGFKKAFTVGHGGIDNWDIKRKLI